MNKTFEKQAFLANKTYGMQMLSFLFITFASLLAAQSIAAVFVWLYKSYNQLIYMQIAQIVSSLGGFLLPALLFGYLSTNYWFSYNYAAQRPPKKMIFIVCLLSVFLLSVVGYIAHLNEQLQLPASFSRIEMIMRMMEDQANAWVEMMMGNLSWLSLPFLFLLFGLIPAVCEEFFFRGTLQNLLYKWTGKTWLSVLLTAFIFSFIHFQFYGFIPRFLIGIYLGYLFVWSRSLWLPILAHFLHNSWSVISFFVIRKYNPELENMNPMDITGFVWILILSAMVIAWGLIKIIRNQHCRIKLSSSDNQ